MDLSNRQIIKKTALKTFAVLMAILLLLVSVFFVFFKKQASALFYNLGLTGASASFAASYYNSTKNINDLAYAVELFISAENHKMVFEYGEKFIDDANFLEYAEFIDSNSDFAKNYEAFIVGNVSASMYMQGSKMLAVTTCQRFTETKYGFSTPFSYLIDVVIKESDVETAKVIDDVLEIKYVSATDKVMKKAIALDGYNVAANQRTTVWSQRYDSLNDSASK